MYTKRRNEKLKGQLGNCKHSQKIGTKTITVKWRNKTFVGDKSFEESNMKALCHEDNVIHINDIVDPNAVEKTSSVFFLCLAMKEKPGNHATDVNIVLESR